jgi:UDP-2-acetamido-3-amino-2,3-dideoxy-glucuronate N-acetyltransferase
MSSGPAATDNQPFFVHPQALVETKEIGARTRVWAFAHVMAGARLGSDCNICDHAFVESGVVLGNNVTVKNGVAIWHGVTIEDDVFLGPNCVLTNDPNPRAYIKKGEDTLTETLIRSHATIGANATIVCGVTIGHYAFIGAGATVIRSIPDFALVVGNPARQTGWMCVCAHRLGAPVAMEIDQRTTCDRCNKSFVKTSHGLALLRNSENH